MTRTDIIDELKMRGIDGLGNHKSALIRFSPISSYYKKRGLEISEAHIYTAATFRHGYLITEEEFLDEEYRKAFFDLIAGELSIFDTRITNCCAFLSV